MNAEPTERPRPPRWLSPRHFLAGFVAGLVLCALAGHWLARRDYHAEFTRFHPAISPEGSYYPTLDEMRSIVRARCRPDRILVVVGGNSILHGVGQPADRMWTHELQRLLGERYAVVNLAFRGAMATDFGAVVAESLRAEYPRQIYVANLAPVGDMLPLGLDDYRYLFWEAYYRGLLEDFAPREAAVAEYWRRHGGAGAAAEKRATVLADAALRYRDLWNWAGYRHLFTLRSAHSPHWPEIVWPRRRLADREDDYETMPFASPTRFGPEKTAAEMDIVRGFTATFYERGPEGWRLTEVRRKIFRELAAAAFPDNLKGRTLLLVGRNSPYYLRQLAPDETARETQAYRDTLELLGLAGYRAREYGRDFADEDYGDRTHLTVTGGRRLAAEIAPEIAAIARGKGWVP